MNKLLMLLLYGVGLLTAIWFFICIQIMSQLKAAQYSFEVGEALGSKLDPVMDYP